VSVYFRYRTYLNVVGMGSKLLGILRGTLWWFSTSQMLKRERKIDFFLSWATPASPPPLIVSPIKSSIVGRFRSS
jgi:hypothetical protein